MIQNPLLKRNLLASTLIPLAISFAVSDLSAEIENKEGQQEVFELNPFEVDASQDVGYYAENSLAGSRLNSSLRDTPVTVQVYTMDFLEDIGATNLQDVLKYSANVEAGQGDEEAFFGGQFALRGFDSFQARVRGLPSSRARDYFTWQLPIDTYLTERVEESRGPNALLFGIAAAGGIQNQSTKKASLSKDFGRLVFRAGDNSLIRGEMDINQVIIKDKLAFRLNAMYEDGDGWRSNTWNRKNGIHGGLTFQPDRKTFLRVGFESFSQDDIPGNTFVELDYVTQWIDAGSPTFDLFSNNRIPQASANGSISANVRDTVLRSVGVTNLATGPQVTIIEGGDPAFDGKAISRYRATFTQQFLDTSGSGKYTVLNQIARDDSLIPYDVSLNGPANKRTLDSTDLVVTLRRELFENFFVQADYNRWSYYWDSMPNNALAQLYGDPNEYYAGLDRTPATAVANPNAGGFYVLNNDHTRWITDRENETMRLSSIYQYSFADKQEGFLSKLGSHRLAAGLERVRYESDQPVVRLAWRDAETGRPAYDLTQPGGTNHVGSMHYIDVNDPSTWSGPTLNSVGKLVEDPLDPTRMIYSEWAQTFKEAWDFVQHVDAFMISTQSFFFNNRLVLTVGYREDSGENKKFLYGENELNTAYVRLGPDDTVRTSWKVENFTTGGVFHLTDQLSIFYNQATNTNIPSAEDVIIGSLENPGQITYPGAGEGEDYGIMASLFGNRVNIRLTRYTSREDNALAPGATQLNGWLHNQVIVWWDEIGFGLADDPAGPRRFQDRVNRYALSKESNGYEFQMTANLTRNWRTTVNYSYTDKNQLNVGIVENQWLDSTIDWITRTIETWDTSTITPEWISAGIVPTNNPEEFLLENGTPVTTLIDNSNVWRENTLVPGVPFGLRRHKFNFFTNYTFSDGRLNGLSIGGGYRYQSENKMHSETNESGEMETIWGESTGYVDGMIRYRTKMQLFGTNFQVTLQLNVDNLLNDHDPIIGRYRGNNSSNPPDRVYYVEPRSWRLSATLDF